MHHLSLSFSSCLCSFPVIYTSIPSLFRQWELGFAHYYNADYRAAAKVFGRCSEVDADDVEPYLWRCMVSGDVWQ